MLRIALASAAAAVATVAVLAQTMPVTANLLGPDPIAARKAVMKEVGAATRAGAAIAKGEAPFDEAKVREILATYAYAGAKMPGLYPAGTETGGETSAAPKIWENRADFNAKLAAWSEHAAKSLVEVEDLAGFRNAFAAATQSCGTCHEVYRLKRS